MKISSKENILAITLGALSLAIVTFAGYFLIDSSRSWIWIGLAAGFAIQRIVRNRTEIDS